jgi:hypothetical protein
LPARRHDDTMKPISRVAIIKAIDVLMPFSPSRLRSWLLLWPPQGHPDQRWGVRDAPHQFFPDDAHRGPPFWRAFAA